MRIELLDMALNRYPPFDYQDSYAVAVPNACHPCLFLLHSAQHGARYLRYSIQSAATECTIHRSTPWNYQQNTLSQSHACPVGCLWKVRKVSDISGRRTSPERGVQQEIHLVRLNSAHSGFDIVAFLMQNRMQEISRHFKTANNI